MDLDQLEIIAAVDGRMHGLDQRRLAHAAGAPEQRIIGRQSAREPLRVLDQSVAHAIDALEQRHVDAIDVLDRREPTPLRMPHEGVGRGEIRRRRRARSEPFDRLGNASKCVALAGRAAGVRFAHRLGFFRLGHSSQPAP
jgi:hypothetical protein